MNRVTDLKSKRGCQEEEIFNCWIARDANPRGIVCGHQLSEDGDLNIVNLHTTAGVFFRNLEDKPTDLIRARQIEQALTRAHSLDSPLIVAGDRNAFSISSKRSVPAGPGVSEGNFRQFFEAGFPSVHGVLHNDDLA